MKINLNITVHQPIQKFAPEPGGATLIDAAVADMKVQSPSKWIGPVIPAREVVLVMGVAIVAGLIVLLQPLLLNNLAAEGRLTVREVGLAATLELTALAGVMTLAVARLRYDRIRSILAATALVALLANLAILFAPNALVVFAALTVHGACGGIFLWPLIGMMVRSRWAARINGIFLAVQGLAGFMVSSLYSTVVIPRYGTDGGFIGLAVICAVSLVASRWLPRSYAPLHGAGHGTVRPTGPGWIALASIFVSMAAVIGTWIYLPLLASQLGYPPSVVRLAVPLAIAMQIVGGITAAALASRLSYNSVIIGGLLSFIAVLSVMVALPSAPLFLFGMAAFGFLWMFIVPFQLPYTAGVDPSRNTMMFVTPALQLGCAAGPLLTSFGVVGRDVRGAAMIGVALFLLCLALFVAAPRACLVVKGPSD
jgi:DHA1 family inner membrane transport protein